MCVIFYFVSYPHYHFLFPVFVCVCLCARGLAHVYNLQSVTIFTRVAENQRVKFSKRDRIKPEQKPVFPQREEKPENL